MKVAAACREPEGRILMGVAHQGMPEESFRSSVSYAASFSSIHSHSPLLCCT